MIALSDRLPVAITPATGDRVISSILVNHDTVADLVMLAATAAIDLKRSVFLADLRDDLARDGYTFDADGWLTDSPS